MTTTDPTAKPEVLFTESPASWNSRYVTPEGFVCQITIRGENGRDLLEKADIALKYLIEHGYTRNPISAAMARAITTARASSA